MAVTQPSAVWLISGCSSGLGRLLAMQALAKGYGAIATARQPATIRDLEEAGARVLQLDVTWSPGRLADFAMEALSIWGRVDVLVSNAGFCQTGAVEELSHDENVAQFSTNFFGVVNLTNAFLPSFRQRGSGTIVNISSMGGILNNPGAGMYCASKAAIDSISDTWSRELAPFGIRCVSIQPGAFATSVSANIKRASKRIEGYDTAHEWISMFDEGTGQEPGDPKKAVERILQLVQLEKLPMRFALGDDGYELVTASHQHILKEFEKNKQLSIGTNRKDLGDPKGGPDFSSFHESG